MSNNYFSAVRTSNLQAKWNYNCLKGNYNWGVDNWLLIIKYQLSIINDENQLLQLLQQQYAGEHPPTFKILLLLFYHIFLTDLGDAWAKAIKLPTRNSIGIGIGIAIAIDVWNLTLLVDTRGIQLEQFKN